MGQKLVQIDLISAVQWRQVQGVGLSEQMSNISKERSVRISSQIWPVRSLERTEERFLWGR